jgi:hypothetical protein
MQQLLFKLGIPSYTTTLFTPIPATAVQQIQIAKQLPKSIGRIYGLSIYCDTVTPANDALITTTDAQNMYISLKDGTDLFYENVRLDDMLSTFTGVPSTRPQVYLPVSIQNEVDLSTSYYLNPTGIVAGANAKTIALKLWFIDKPTYNMMLKNKMFMTNAMNVG